MPTSVTQARPRRCKFRRATSALAVSIVLALLAVAAPASATSPTADLSYRLAQGGDDTDDDGIADSLDGDDDNDGIADADECNGACESTDTDGDGRPDSLDLDSDNDGISDFTESGQTGDDNVDGMPDDFVDVDVDGIHDLTELANGDGRGVSASDSDGDGIPNHLDLDSDNDGIPDFVEARSTVGFEQPLGTTPGVIDPIDCGPGFIQVINDTSYGRGQLFITDPITGANVPVGEPAGFKINAIGYDPETRLIYGSARQAGIDAVGVAVPKGAVVAIDLDGEAFLVHDEARITVSATMIGRELVGFLSRTLVVSIDVDTGTLSKVALDPALSAAATDVIAVAGQLFALDRGTLIRVSDPLGAATVEEFPNLIESSSVFGSAFTATDEQSGEVSIYFFENKTGSLYVVNDHAGPSPTVEFWGQAQESNSNDGTSCEAATAPAEEDDTDDDGVPDWWDPDVDGDGVWNSGLVVPVNSDFLDDGADYIDLDSDEDTVPDSVESGLDLDGRDTDRDGIDDALAASYRSPQGAISNPLADLKRDSVSATEVSYRTFVLPPELEDPDDATVTREVVFVVDGSLSIDETDWAVQLGGIAAALKDPTAFPINGSVGVGLIQWSDNAEEELPFTVLDTAETLEAVLDTIGSITQNLGGTSPEVGITAGAEMLARHGSSEAEQVLCVSTDGKPVNTPKVTAAGAAAAESGIDGMTLLAIDDPSRNFDAAGAQLHYGEAVFGTGSIIQARSSVEFASLVASGCLSGALSLVAIEVNQAVQDWAGSVPLVEGKPTLVRAFIQSLDSSPDRVVARLHGERDGIALPSSPLAPFNPGGSVLAYQNARARRHDLNASANFALPDSWLTGDVTLRVEVLGGSALCREAISPSGTCSALVNFDPVQAPKLDMVRVQYDDNGVSAIPTRDEIAEQARRLSSALPTGGIEYDERILFTGSNGAPSLDDLNEKLRSARTIDGNGQLYLGVLTGDRLSEAATDTTVGAASWFLDDAGAEGATGSGRNNAVQSFARAMGEALASDDLGSIYCSNPAERIEGAPVYPHPKVMNDRTVAGLGVTGSSDTEIWGIDVRSLAVSDQLAIVDPNSVYSVVSLCRPQVEESQGQWIDAFHYERLRTSLNTIDWGVGPAQPEAARYTFFRGAIGGAGEVVTARLDQTFAVDSAQMPESQEEGVFTLDLLDAAGTVIRSVRFEPTPMNAATPDESGVFNIPIEGAPEFAAAVISKRETELVRQQASSNAPAVIVTAPKSGDVITDSDLTVSWIGGDADGDPLTYLVQYSVDAGATYETVAIDYPGTELILPRDALTGSDQVQVRVTASDGALSNSSSSSVFTVTNGAPTLAITAPHTDQRFDGVQSVVLEAEAIDAEDGTLGGAAISWTSSIDGELGVGDQLVLNAGDLQEGVHTFFARVVDSAGLSSTDQVDVEIRRIAAPPQDSALCQGLVITVDIGYGEVPTQGDDVILGTSGDDQIFAGEGDDIICGLGGNDRILGQAGNDIIFGESGVDVLRGGPGDDRLYGGDDGDDLNGGQGNDFVYGEGGDDTAVRGGTGDDTVDGGEGNDTIVAGNGGSDVVTGGGGDDKVTGGPRPDNVSGGDGADEVKGNKGADTLAGGPGNDSLLGGPQPDVLDGGNGTDSCNGGTTGSDDNGVVALENDTSINCETVTSVP